MKGYFLLVDILGFKNIIESLSVSKLSTRINEWVSLVEKAANKYSINKYSLISDTLFVSTPSNTEGLNNIILMAQYLLEKGISNWDNLVYGKAVIEAHKIEKNQNWMGITCSTNIPHVDEYWGENKLICYSPPMKTGILSFYPVVSWKIPNFKKLCTLLVKGGLVPKGKYEKVTYEWLERINNTIIFSSYKNVIIKMNLSCNKAHGISAVAYLEDYIYKTLNSSYDKLIC